MKITVSQKLILALLTLISISVFFVSCKQKAATTEVQEKPYFDNKSEIDSVIDHFVEEGYYPVMYALLEDKEGKAIYDHGSINNKMFPNKEVTKDSWFRIWSMSKIVTISLALDLVEDGLIKLDDAVVDYIPEFKNLKVAVNLDGKSLTSQSNEENQIDNCPIKLVPMESTMTILDLITHKAGFYYALTGMPCIDEPLAQLDIVNSKDSKAFIDKLASLPLIQQPGDDPHYGLNTTVLGFVAERATNKTLKQLVVERITDPLKIEGLQYHLPKGEFLIPPVSGNDTILRLAKPGELDIFGPNVPDYDAEHPLFLGGEGMVATADGYTDFIRMLLNGGTLNGHRFLNEETVKEIHSPHTQLDNPYGYNGYNLWVSSDSMRIHGFGDEGLWLGGGYEGTHFWVDPKREFVGIFLTQIFEVPPGGEEKDDRIRGLFY